MNERHISHEISLLQFHRRVLDNAFDRRHPLCVRLMFLKIVNKNLDEFYMRVFPNIRQRIDSIVMASDGVNLHETYDDISEYTEDFIENINEATEKVLFELERNGVYIKHIKELNSNEKTALEEHFHDSIKPFLTPTILDATHPFPLIPNGVLTLVYKLSQYSFSGVCATHMVIVLPPHIKRLIKLSDVPLVYVQLEEAIEYFFKYLTPMHCLIEDFCFFKLIRDHNVRIDEDIRNMAIDSINIIKRRRSGNIVKLFTPHTTSQKMRNFLMHTLHISEEDMIKVKYSLGLDCFYELIAESRPDLSYQSMASRYPRRISDFGGDYFRAIIEKDLIVHHPFESFDVFLGFLRQAATDPNVALIKQTLYRTTTNSAVVQELIRASENGKQVVVLVELRASMDEENNITLARILEESGIQVVYGTLDYKTHAKICFVVRNNGTKTEEFLHIGTGNYHPVNAKMYTDLSFFTANPTLCNEANDVFNFITGSIPPQKPSKIFASPLTLKENLLSHIAQEIANKKDGKPAGLWFKCNAITDKEIINALYEASYAGVPCQLIIRGICLLRPGVPGLSENISVKSVVGRYLEHSRIYCFANGFEMPCLENVVYISSADLMTRNLDQRIEIMALMETQTVKTQVINEILKNYLRDTRNSWKMNSDGTYSYIGNRRTKGQKMPHFDVHEYFSTHESVSGQGLDF